MLLLPYGLLPTLSCCVDQTSLTSGSRMVTLHRGGEGERPLVLSHGGAQEHTNTRTRRRKKEGKSHQSRGQTVLLKQTPEKPPTSDIKEPAAIVRNGLNHPTPNKIHSSLCQRSSKCQQESLNHIRGVRGSFHGSSSAIVKSLPPSPWIRKHEYKLYSGDWGTRPYGGIDQSDCFSTGSGL